MNRLTFKREELAIERKLLKKYQFPENGRQGQIRQNSIQLIQMIEQEIKELENERIR